MTTAWRKSSYSSDNGGNCVEVGCLAQGVGVRDSKSPEHGHLDLTAAQFTALLSRVKRSHTLR